MRRLRENSGRSVIQALGNGASDIGRRVLARAGRRAHSLRCQDLKFFETHIRPLLAERCFKCHGWQAARRAAARFASCCFDGRRFGRGGVRLAARLTAYCCKRFVTNREMPPDGRLPAEHVALIEAWIGAARRGPPSQPHPTRPVPACGAAANLRPKTAPGGHFSRCPHRPWRRSRTIGFALRSTRSSETECGSRMSRPRLKRIVGRRLAARCSTSGVCPLRPKPSMRLRRKLPARGCLRAAHRFTPCQPAIWRTLVR